MSLKPHTDTQPPTDFSAALALENTQLALHIDHTKLTFSVGEDESQAIAQLCQEAKAHGFYAVCVRPQHVSLAKAQLQESGVKVATVIGFPADKMLLAQELAHPTVGQIPTADKIEEIRQAVQAGADELDVVMNVAQLKKDLQTGNQLVIEELRAIQTAAPRLPIKVIIETDLLTAPEIQGATTACAQTGMGMVKTSTGMVTNGQGATLDTVEQIAQQLQALNASTGIKASGGIKNRAQALAFLALGVQRLGTSAGVAILQGQPIAPDTY